MNWPEAFMAVGEALIGAIVVIALFTDVLEKLASKGKIVERVEVIPESTSDAVQEVISEMRRAAAGPGVLNVQLIDWAEQLDDAIADEE